MSTAESSIRLAPTLWDDPDVQRLADAQFPGIGPTGASVFLREAQAVWPWVRPYLDDRARAGARRVDLPEEPERLAALVDDGELARFAAALVRISLLPARADPLGNPGTAAVVE